MLQLPWILLGLLDADFGATGFGAAGRVRGSARR
jgi:hypothetical protein